MTLKKQRQQLSSSIKRGMGLKDFKLSMILARFIVDYKGNQNEIRELLTIQFGEPKFFKGCSCCGDSSYIWKGSKNKYIEFQYGQFKLV